MLDPAFWTLLFSQWLKEPASEYHRVEVIYDVLLPWLAQEQLPAALARTATDPHAHWRTPQRSNSSHLRSTLEAVRYVLSSRGVGKGALKQLGFALRRSLLTRALAELREMDADGMKARAREREENEKV